MVRWLGFEPYKTTYSSDYFDRLYEMAEKLVTMEKAYVCSCDGEAHVGFRAMISLSKHVTDMSRHPLTRLQ